MEFSHIPVLLHECMDGLNIREDGIYVDGTAGGGGHSSEIAKRLTTGRLVSLDQDPDAIKAATERLAPFPSAQVVQANFRNMSSALQSVGVQKADGVLLDLGVSSFQLDTAERGFSYQKDAPLDMRMSQTGLSAWDIVNTYDAPEIARILREYGEEKFAYKIALSIVRRREKAPIQTTFELGDIIKASVPAASRRDKNPCKRSFQALRIAVNAELDALSQGIDEAFDCLHIGGRLVIITFHSIEDRIVKQKFQHLCQGCTCPPNFPVCICHNESKAERVNRKPIVSSSQELEENRRSQSAKLRILEKCKERN